MAGLRERKKEQTRQALSWAAVRLSVERGFDNVLVEDIAAEAGVSPRTFNNYFSSKAEAIAARHVDHIRQVARLLRDRPADEPIWPAVAGAMTTLYDYGDEPPPEGWTEGVRVMASTPALQGEFVKASTAAWELLAEAVSERTGTDPGRDLYPRLVANMVGVAYDAATHIWLTTDPPPRLADLIRDALDQVAAGLPDPTH